MEFHGCEPALAQKACDALLVNQSAPAELCRGERRREIQMQSRIHVVLPRQTCRAFRVRHEDHGAGRGDRGPQQAIQNTVGGGCTMPQSSALTITVVIGVAPALSASRPPIFRSTRRLRSTRRARPSSLCRPPSRKNRASCAISSLRRNARSSRGTGRSTPRSAAHDVARKDCHPAQHVRPLGHLVQAPGKPPTADDCR